MTSTKTNKADYFPMIHNPFFLTLCLCTSSWNSNIIQWEKESHYPVTFILPRVLKLTTEWIISMKFSQQVNSNIYSETWPLQSVGTFSSSRNVVKNKQNLSYTRIHTSRLSKNPPLVLRNLQPLPFVSPLTAPIPVPLSFSYLATKLSFI